MTSVQYYAFINGEVAGPYDALQLRSLALAPETQVCQVGSEEWVMLSQAFALVASADNPAPVGATGRLPVTQKKKIFIIHGRGNTMDDAFGHLLDLFNAKFRFFRGQYYVDEQNSNFARYLLYEDHANPFLALFSRIVVGKLAIAPLFPPADDWQPDKSWSKLSEYKVSDKLGKFGVPSSLGAVKEWTDRFFYEVWAEYTRRVGDRAVNQPDLKDSLAELRKSLRPEGGGRYTEKEYKDAIRWIFHQNGGEAEPFIEMLLELQRLNDAGGDLDTIASNALYGAWLQQAWTAEFGTPPRYGRDFEFDFVNYHQSFLHLTRHANAEIYLPDFPMEAIPDLMESAQALRDVGSEYVRIDDHHPLGQERIDLLAEMKESGLLGEWVMSGPLKGTEQPEDERTCGADLVHYAALKDTPFDSPGLEELRRLAHQQDLHFVENPDDRTHPDYLAIDLSKLIGSKHSRIDMAQQLMMVRSFEDIRGIMASTGWRAIVDHYEGNLEEIFPKLEESLAMIEFVMPEELATLKLPPKWFVKLIKLVTFGAVDLEARALAKNPSFFHRIMVVLAPFQSRKEHRINVASAIGYLKRYYRFDYFFFAWGSSLLTTRRYNGDDQVLDLSVLMSKIGGPGDGGHSSAATCKPPSNPAWPAERFSKLNKKNFLEYAQYIASRLEAGTSAKVASIRPVGENDRDFQG